VYRETLEGTEGISTKKMKMLMSVLVERKASVYGIWFGCVYTLKTKEAVSHNQLNLEQAIYQCT
jgi:hypothetical protein